MMRFFIKHTLALLAALSVTTVAHAQWQPTTFHGSAFTLAHNSKVIVTSDTNGSFFHTQIGQQWSSDLGQTWHHSTNGPPAMMKINARGEGFYGVSTSKISTGPPARYASTLWESTDNAQTWDSIAAIPANGSYHMDDAGFHYYGEDTMQYLSLDGKTWTHDTTAVRSLRIPDTLNYATLYGSDSIVAISNAGVIKYSPDAGLTWTTVYDAGKKYVYWFREQSKLLASNRYDPLILSTDRGFHWQHIDTSGILRTSGHSFDITAFTITDSSLFVALYGSTIMRLPLPLNATVSRRESAWLRVFPNPAHDVLHIDGLAEHTPVQIIDALGRIVLSQQTSSDAVDVRALATGAYTLIVNGEHLRFVK